MKLEIIWLGSQEFHNNLYKYGEHFPQPITIVSQKINLK